MAETAPETNAHLRLDSGFDADDFGRQLRRFASDAGRILARRDSSIDDLIGLHRRVWFLLGETPGVQSSAIRRWLLAVRQAIATQLQSWAEEELESLVA